MFISRLSLNKAAMAVLVQLVQNEGAPALYKGHSRKVTGKRKMLLPLCLVHENNLKNNGK